MFNILFSYEDENIGGFSNLRYQTCTFNNKILKAFKIEIADRRMLLNISKAFDKVWHDGLILPLHQMVFMAI